MSDEILNNPIAESYWRAVIVKEIEALTTTVANSDFEQGFFKAKALAIAAAKGKR